MLYRIFAWASVLSCLPAAATAPAFAAGGASCAAAFSGRLQGSPNPDALRFTFTDPAIPAGYGDELRSAYLGIRRMLYPAMIIPTRLDVRVKMEYNNAAYKFDPKVQSIGIPYRFTVQGGRTVEGKAALPVFAHEFGHYVHYMNMMKRSPAIREFLLKGHAELEKKLHETTELENQLIGAKMKLISVPAGSSQAAELQKEMDRLAPLVKKAQEETHASATLFRERHDAISGFSEMTADLISVLYFDNPEAMTLVSPPGPEAEARSFLNTLDPAKWTETEEHGILGPSRAALWRFGKEHRLSKAALVNLAIDAGITEIEKVLAGAPGLVPAELNAAFMRALGSLYNSKKSQVTQ